MPRKKRLKPKYLHATELICGRFFVSRVEKYTLQNSLRNSGKTRQSKAKPRYCDPNGEERDTSGAFSVSTHSSPFSNRASRKTATARRLLRFDYALSPLPRKSQSLALVESCYTQCLHITGLQKVCFKQDIDKGMSRESQSFVDPKARSKHPICSSHRRLPLENLQPTATEPLSFHRIPWSIRWSVPSLCLRRRRDRNAAVRGTPLVGHASRPPLERFAAE